MLSFAKDKATARIAGEFGPQHLGIGDTDHADMPVDHGEGGVQKRVQPVRPDQADDRDHAAGASARSPQARFPA